ncbi:Uncharacterized protein, DUF1810 family [Cribrihabitans marinus]|uniref:Uncharacterized protein, DUF1810 family n=1 Tax=Cribrihabitans marinus TaxID=1227549 RepID=A0A1H6YHG7_9RHOB|nr:DUF1810 domain-containing protein [Cribrihabitans marinus]GGH29023.1 calpastatin [Cribrihabitans marinus]SEJ39274.1 Uncharacterized protein, DUF1810 family [Cribrihabitans marinus]
MSETDPELFLEAQDTVWAEVTRELAEGKKTGHWMWFVFPQLAELGQSPISQLYGLHDLDEAAAYLDHPELKRRLVEVADLMLTHEGTPAKQILGQVDAMKLRSSMTLFSRVPEAPDSFARVLDAFYDGRPCTETLRLIGRN